MVKFLIGIWILIIGFIIGLLLGLAKPALDKSISEEIKAGRTFWVGEIHFMPTKYKNLHLAEIVDSGKRKENKMFTFWGYWCKPLVCHGDILARIADES